MPELPDVEGYRHTFNRHAAGKRVRGVSGIDRSMLRDTTPQALSRALKGRRLEAAQRHGKLLLCPTDSDKTLVLHFGMTGTLLWCRDEPRHNHDRLTLAFDDGQLRYRNMRKFGGIWLARGEELNLMRERLGPDWLSVSRPVFDGLLEGRRATLKATLMNQAVAAGLGNLTADEALWQARLDPRRTAASLDADERAALYRSIRKVLRDSLPYGLVPSKRTWLTGARGSGERHCPRCGARLERRTIAGRTTFFCPEEQR